MQSFTQAGEFTTWGKLRSALRDNIVYYSSYFVIAVILVIYISLKPGEQYPRFPFYQQFTHNFLLQYSGAIHKNTLECKRKQPDIQDAHHVFR
jgi:hypothetical protein